MALYTCAECSVYRMIIIMIIKQFTHYIDIGVLITINDVIYLTRYIYLIINYIYMNTRILSNKMGDWEGAVGLLRDPGEPCRTRRAPEARAPSPAREPCHQRRAHGARAPSPARKPGWYISSGRLPSIRERCTQRSFNRGP